MRSAFSTWGTTPVTPPRGWFLKSMPHSAAKTSTSMEAETPAWLTNSATSKPMPPAPMMATFFPNFTLPLMTSM